MTPFLLDTERKSSQKYSGYVRCTVGQHLRGQIQQRAWVRETGRGQFCFDAVRPWVWRSVLLRTLDLEGEGEGNETCSSGEWLPPGPRVQLSRHVGPVCRVISTLVWGFGSTDWLGLKILATKTWLGLRESFCQ